MTTAALLGAFRRELEAEGFDPEMVADLVKMAAHDVHFGVEIKVNEPVAS